MSPAIKCLILLAVVALFFVTELEGITEELKSKNQTEWACQMNSIKARVIDVVNAELIYI